MIIFWLEAQPWSYSAASAVNVYATSSDLSAAVFVNGFATEYLPVLDGGPILSTNVFNGAFNGTVDASRGTINLTDGPGDIDVWGTYAWPGRPVQIYMAVLDTTNPIAPVMGARTLIFTGVAESYDPDGTTLNLASLKPTGKLANTTYAGTGGLEGSPGMVSTVKPVSIGYQINRPARLLDSTKELFQVNAAGALASLVYVREGGAILDQAGVAHSTFADLNAATVPATEIHYHLASGTFRLGFTPVADISADYRGLVAGQNYPSTISGILTNLLALSGWNMAKVDSSSFSSIDATLTGEAAFHDETGTDIADALTGLMQGCGGYWDVDPLGIFYVGLVSQAGTADFSIGDEGVAGYDLLETDFLPTRAPFWRNRVAWGFNPTTMSFSDTEYGATPDQVTQINATQARVTAVTSDNVITAGQETRDLIDAYNDVLSTYNQLNAESYNFISQYGSDYTASFRTSADTAKANLANYLTGLSPAWNDTTQDKTVNGATLSGYFSTLENANETLRTANNAIARIKATWSGTSNDNGLRPTDGATADLVLIGSGDTPPTITGNTVRGNGDNSAWKGYAASVIGIAGPCAVSGQLPASSRLMLGLSVNQTPPTTNITFSSLLLAIYIDGNNNFQTYSNGNARLSLGQNAYPTSTIWTIAWDGQTMFVLADGKLVDQIAYTTTSKVYAAVALAWNTAATALTFRSYADVTALNTVQIVDPQGLKTIPADYNGVVSSGALPTTMARLNVTRGGTDISLLDTTTYATLNYTGGCSSSNVSVDNGNGSATKGQVTIGTGLTTSGTYDLVVYINNIAQTPVTRSVKVVNGSPPASSGGTGGSGSSGGTFSSGGFTAASTSFAEVGRISGVTLPSGKSLKGYFNDYYSINPSGAHATQTGAIQGKWQYSVAGANSWTDFAAAVVGTSAKYVWSNGSDSDGQLIANQPATPAAGNYDVRFVAAASTASNTLSFDGQTQTVSVA